MGTYYCLKTKKCYLGTINFLLLSLIIISGAFYLVGMNNLVVKGFKLDEARHNLGVLSSANQDLRNQQLALGSYGSLDDKMKSLNLVAIDQIDYITTVNGVLAKK